MSAKQKSNAHRNTSKQALLERSSDRNRRIFARRPTEVGGTPNRNQRRCRPTGRRRRRGNARRRAPTPRDGLVGASIQISASNSNAKCGKKKNSFASLVLSLRVMIGSDFRRGIVSRLLVRFLFGGQSNVRLRHAKVWRRRRFASFGLVLGHAVGRGVVLEGQCQWKSSRRSLACRR